MEIASFYNITPINTERLKDNSFSCIILKGKQLEEYRKIYGISEVQNQTKYYYPTDYSNVNCAFIYGLGILKGKKIVTIPSYDGTIEGWNDYVLKYGYACLFYSLTGYSLHSPDCCALAMQREFKSLIMSNWGLHKYAKFVDCYRRMNDIQLNALRKLGNFYKETYYKYLFMPCFSLYGILPIEPSCDILVDDDKLKRFYKDIRIGEMIKIGKSELEIIETLDKEIADRIFPISVKDRIKYLYGEECVKLYEQAMAEVGLSF